MGTLYRHSCTTEDEATDSDDPLTFPLPPPAGRHFNLSTALVYDQTLLFPSGVLYC